MVEGLCSGLQADGVLLSCYLKAVNVMRRELTSVRGWMMWWCSEGSGGVFVAVLR